MMDQQKYILVEPLKEPISMVLGGLSNIVYKKRGENVGELKKVFDNFKLSRLVLKPSTTLQLKVDFFNHEKIVESLEISFGFIPKEISLKNSNITNRKISNIKFGAFLKERFTNNYKGTVEVHLN